MTVSTARTILVWRNGQWTTMPHRDFFVNMLEQEIKKAVGYNAKRKIELSTRVHLGMGESVKANGSWFRLKREKQETQGVAA